MLHVSHLDRCMFEAEGIVWSSIEALSAIEHSGAFADRISSAQDTLKRIAEEMRTYNDQFEE